MKVLRFIFGLPLAVIILIPCISIVMVTIFIISIYGSIKYKESFKTIFAEFYESFVEGIRIGIN